MLLEFPHWEESLDFSSRDKQLVNDKKQEEDSEKQNESKKDADNFPTNTNTWNHQETDRRIHHRIQKHQAEVYRRNHHFRATESLNGKKRFGQRPFILFVVVSDFFFRS